MGEYADIGPVHTWYETHGQGQSLLLLHGDLDTNAAWAGQVDALAEHFRVIAPERRGQGHTPDVEGPVTYQVMADDTAGFIDKVIGEPVHLIGWSGGGVLGLLIAWARPDLVRKLVLIGATADIDGYIPGFMEFTRLPAGSDVYQPYRAAYEAASPDGPGHWPVVFAKQMKMWQTEPHIPLTSLAAIGARTLVMVGDDDLITPEHAIAMYRAIPNAELAVIPGASHMAPMEKPELVNRLLLDFLRHDASPTLMPIRRAAAPAHA
jgi:pimeloyl-ACP methyl ester carboxylesterase